jgi:hypothetical protein
MTRKYALRYRGGIRAVYHLGKNSDELFARRSGRRAERRHFVLFGEDVLMKYIGPTAVRGASSRETIVFIGL